MQAWLYWGGNKHALHHGGAIFLSVSYTLTPTYPHLSSAAIPYNRWVHQISSWIQKLDYGANVRLEAFPFPHFNQFFIHYFRSLFSFSLHLCGSYLQSSVRSSEEKLKGYVNIWLPSNSTFLWIISLQLMLHPAWQIQDSLLYYKQNWTHILNTKMKWLGWVIFRGFFKKKCRQLQKFSFLLCFLSRSSLLCFSNPSGKNSKDNDLEFFSENPILLFLLFYILAIF